MRLALTVLLAALASQAHALQCSAQSGPHTAALVELYTSEGCDSCPPADRWLQGLAAQGFAPGRVVPLSLHVNYWDYIGWKDPYAQQRFADRQRKLAQVIRARVVYTPPGHAPGARLLPLVCRRGLRKGGGQDQCPAGGGAYRPAPGGGPIPFTAGRIRQQWDLPLLPKAVPGHSGVAAFVQNRRTAQVLQALMLPACPGWD